MRDADRFRLLGTYRTPRVRVGFGELAAAVRRESSQAVCHWFHRVDCQGSGSSGPLVEGSHDAADEMAVSRLTQFDDTKAAGKHPADRKPDAKR